MITIDISNLKHIRLGSSDENELESLMERAFDAVDYYRKDEIARQFLYYMRDHLSAADILDTFGEEDIVAELRKRDYDIKEIEEAEP